MIINFPNTTMEVQRTTKEVSNANVDETLVDPKNVTDEKVPGEPGFQEQKESRIERLRYISYKKKINM